MKNRTDPTRVPTGVRYLDEILNGGLPIFFDCNWPGAACDDFALAGLFARRTKSVPVTYAATAPAARCAKLVVMKSMNARTRAVR